MIDVMGEAVNASRKVRGVKAIDVYHAEINTLLLLRLRSFLMNYCLKIAIELLLEHLLNYYYDKVNCTTEFR